MTDPDALRNALEKRLAAGGDDALLRFTLGKCYLRQADFSTAITHIKAALAHKPDYSAAWALLGTAYLKHGDEETATETWTQGIKVADEKGDLQTFRQMTALLAKLQRHSGRL